MHTGQSSSTTFTFSLSYSDAADLVELHLLCHPESEFARGMQSREGVRPTDQHLVKVTGSITSVMRRIGSLLNFTSCFKSLLQTCPPHLSFGVTSQSTAA